MYSLPTKYTFIHLEAKWLLGFPGAHPLVKFVRRNQAPAGLHGIAERWRCCRCFRPRVDHPRRAGRVFDHEGMSPPHISDSFRMGSFGFWRITGTGCVGAMSYRRIPVWFVGNAVEIFLDNLLSPRKSVATAHREIMADRIVSRLWECGQMAFPALAALYRSRSLRVGLRALGIVRSDRFVCLDCFETPAESNPKT